MRFFKSSIILFLLCLSFTTTIYATSSVTSTTVKEYSNNTDISGSIPSVTNSNETLSKTINNEITNIYTKRSNTAKTSNAKTLTFSYEVFESGSYTSIVITSKISKLRAISYIDTIVYDGTKLYTLDTYLSSADLKVFNKSINDKIKQNPENYKVSEVILNDKSAFYIKGGVVYVGFDGDTISSSTDVSTFSFTQTNYSKYTLTKDSYYLQSTTQTKYIPIREVYTNLGYNVSYKNKTIYISDLNNKLLVTFDTDDTDKSVTTSTSTIYTPNLSQKYKALVTDGVSYAPLSIVQSTTGTIYDIQSNGDIIFPLVN